MASVLFQSLRHILYLKSEVTTINAANLFRNYCKRNQNTMDKLSEWFVGEEDKHNGIIVDSTREPCSLDVINKRLQASIERWMQSKKRAIWFHVNRRDSSWIPHLVNEGFYYHHTKGQVLVLYRCLSDEDNMPPYAHTNVGVGSFVINEKTNEVLVVKEKYKVPDALAKWKLPGGFVEPCECIPDAAEREVFEETGIRAKFKSLIGFRHAHHYNFDCSDIYMVARLIPETFEIRKDDIEIAECMWMKLEDYASSSDVHELNRLIARKIMDAMKNKIEIELIHGQRPNSTEPIWIYLLTKN